MEEDLKNLKIYIKILYFKHNPSKSIISIFNLDNKMASQIMIVNFYCQPIKHDPSPTYLGLTLDYTLKRINSTRKKSELKIRTSMISKLAGTNLSSITQVLRTSTMTLLYSKAEYYLYFWEGSTHCKLVDFEPRKALRVVTGTGKSTKI